MKSARKAFEDFPTNAQNQILTTLTVVADGGYPEIVKPMKGLGAGVHEIALRFRGDAYRAVFTLEFHDAVWVVHAFQKKSTSGIKTPRHEIDLVIDRINRLKEILK